MKRLRFICTPYRAERLYLGSTRASFTLLHPSTGVPHDFLVYVHESGDIVVRGPSFAFKEISARLGDGETATPQERIERLVGGLVGIATMQDRINEQHLLSICPRGFEYTPPTTAIR